MARAIRIGTSGWNYRHWKEVFYPKKLPSSQWFEHYCRTFDTVEINNTFYRLPESATFNAWRKQAPPGFLYAVKANRYLTHMLKLKNARDPLRRLFSRAKRLGDTLGPILYQLPPRWKKNLERLSEFIQLLPKGLTHVMEFREREWLADDTYELLTAHQICLCVHDILPRHPREITGRAVYVRFHGATGQSAGGYSTTALKRWAAWIAGVAEKREVFAYFNNDLHGHAVRNALTLKKLLNLDVARDAEWDKRRGIPTRVAVATMKR